MLGLTRKEVAMTAHTLLHASMLLQARSLLSCHQQLPLSAQQFTLLKQREKSYLDCQALALLLPHTTIGQMTLHPCQQLLGERFCVLHPAHYVHHHLRIALPLVVAEVDVEVGHGPEDGHQGLQGGE